MANITIPNLPAVSAISGSFLLESVTAPSGGSSVRITIDQIAAYAGAAYGLTPIPTNYLLGNISGVSAIPTANTLTAYMDAAFGTTQGLVLYRGSTNWQALPTGNNGEVLQTHGSGANPTWYAIPSSIGGGTVTQVNTTGNLTGGPITVTGTLNTVQNPTFTTSVTSPIYIGGTGAASSLTLQSTSGVGTTDSIIFKTGNNGAVTALTIASNGNATFLSTSTTAIGTLSLTNALTAANGGTGQSSYAVGDLLYASGATTLSKLADVATGNALISGGVGVAPSWGKIGLTTHVSGTLAVGNGGTGAITFTANGILYGNTTSAIGVTAAGTTGQVLVGNTGAAPSWSAATSVSVTSISFGTTGLTPSTATQGVVTVAGTLVAANGGTGQSSYVVGDILYASTTTALSKLAAVASGSVLVSAGTGTAPAYSSSPTISGTTTSAYFIANGATSGSRNQGAYAYGTLGFSDQNVLASFQSSVNTYNQILVQNTSGGVNASTAIVIGNDLSTASTYYGEFGMNSSGFSGTGSLNAVNAVYVTATTADLVLGTTTANAIKFVVNSGTTDAMSIASTGAVSVTSSITAATVTATVGAGFQNMVVLTSGASWSLPAALQVTGAKFKITVIGGGGAGGGNPATAATAGGGGGAGGVAIAYLTYVAGQNSVTTSFGAAGTGSSGAIGGSGTATTATYNSLTYIGTGGAGGALGAATSAGGAGGTGSTGTGTVTLAMTGQNGGAGGTTTAVAGVTYLNNKGGDAALGLGQGGLMPFNAATGVVGNAGIGYGAGGSGSVAGSTATARAGGNGTAGAIIIEY